MSLRCRGRKCEGNEEEEDIQIVRSQHRHTWVCFSFSFPTLLGIKRTTETSLDGW